MKYFKNSYQIYHFFDLKRQSKLNTLTSEQLEHIAEDLDIDIGLDINVDDIVDQIMDDDTTEKEITQKKSHQENLEHQNKGTMSFQDLKDLAGLHSIVPGRSKKKIIEQLEQEKNGELELSEYTTQWLKNEIERNKLLIGHGTREEMIKRIDDFETGHAVVSDFQNTTVFEKFVEKWLKHYKLKTSGKFTLKQQRLQEYHALLSDLAEKKLVETESPNENGRRLLNFGLGKSVRSDFESEKAFNNFVTSWLKKHNLFEDGSAEMKQRRLYNFNRGNSIMADFKIDALRKMLETRGQSPVSKRSKVSDKVLDERSVLLLRLYPLIHAELRLQIDKLKYKVAADTIERAATVERGKNEAKLKKKRRRKDRRPPPDAHFSTFEKIVMGTTVAATIFGNRAETRLKF